MPIELECSLQRSSGDCARTLPGFLLSMDVCGSTSGCSSRSFLMVFLMTRIRDLIVPCWQCASDGDTLTPMLSICIGLHKLCLMTSWFEDQRESSLALDGEPTTCQ